jgi:hypothetical protein
MRADPDPQPAHDLVDLAVVAGQTPAKPARI